MGPRQALSDGKPSVRVRRTTLALSALLALTTVVVALPAPTKAEQASSPLVAAIRGLDVGFSYSCARIPEAAVRCWGFNREGELGYGNTLTIGVGERPSAAGPIDFGEGRTVKAFSAGDYHACAILDDETVRCWGFGRNGRLGYGTGTPEMPGPSKQENVGDDESPGSMPPVDLGGQGAKAISAGGAHTCAVLNDGTVRCWGYAFWGELGYGGAVPDPDPQRNINAPDIGDDEAPGSVGPVDLGGHAAKAISAGDLHTCAVLDDDSVRCWGLGYNGQLGYGNTKSIGDDETAGTVGPVDIGVNRTARAISAGVGETCAVLDGGDVRCWGVGGNGRLGYGNSSAVGKTPETLPGSAGPVDLGADRTATAVAVGDAYACAVLDGGDVRCWGYNIDGRLGYGNKLEVGNLPDRLPGSVGPVNLGAGRKATAIALGRRHTCARLDDGTADFDDAEVRCWGHGSNGRLGLCGQGNVGDDEMPASVDPVELGVPGGGASGCPLVPPGPPGPRTSTPPRSPGTVTQPRSEDPAAAQKARARGLRSCLREASRHAKREARGVRRLSGSRAVRARRHLQRHRLRLRRACLKRYGRTPGRVTGLKARAASRTKIILTIRAPGTDGAKGPAARVYLVKQSRGRIGGARSFRRAHSLCNGRCGFAATTTVGGKLTVTVTGLRPRTTYYYSVAARDNVSRRLGRRSKTVRVRTK